MTTEAQDKKFYFDPSEAEQEAERVNRYLQASPEEQAAMRAESELTARSYKSALFAHAEEQIQEIIDALPGTSERNRRDLMPDLSARLATCRLIGASAGIPMPTEVMTEAEQAILTTPIDY